MHAIVRVPPWGPISCGRGQSSRSFPSGSTKRMPGLTITSWLNLSENPRTGNPHGFAVEVNRPCQVVNSGFAINNGDTDPAFRQQVGQFCARRAKADGDHIRTVGKPAHLAVFRQVRHCVS